MEAIRALLQSLREVRELGLLGYPNVACDRPVPVESDGGEEEGV